MYTLHCTLILLRVCGCLDPFLPLLWLCDFVHGFVCRLDEAVRRIAGHLSSKSTAQKGWEAEVGKNASKSELVER